MSAENLLEEMMNYFTDPDQLIEFASANGLLEDSIIQNRLRHIHDMEEIHKDAEETLKTKVNEFHSNQSLENWAIQNNVLQDKIVQARLKELSFMCDICLKSFKSMFNLKRHKDSIHKEMKHVCSKCNKSFSTIENKSKHESTCTGPPIKLANLQCETCKKEFTTPYSLMKHKCIIQCESCKKTFKSKKGLEKHICGHSIRCRECNERFMSRSNLYDHYQLLHNQMGGRDELQVPPWGNRVAPWENDQGDTVDHELKRTYETHTSVILDTHLESQMQSIFNFPVDNALSIDQLMNQVNEIYDRQNRAFKLNLIFGLILKNTETDAFRYFKPYTNEYVFEKPIYVSKRKDLKKIRSRFQQLNITTYMLRQRPDTKWKPFLLTNVRYWINPTHFPLGGPAVLPQYLLDNMSLISMTKSKKGKHTYQDNLCAFRCLAYHREGKSKFLVHKQFEASTKHYFDKYIAVRKLSVKDFPGVDIKDMPDFESCFQLNVNIFSLDDKGSATPVYKSRCRYEDTMNLNVFKSHLSYITKMESYCSKYQCKTCDRLFSTSCHWIRHQRKCTNQTKYNFPGGFFNAPQTIFEQLEEYGIIVKEEDRFFPWFAVFDFESLLITRREQNSEKLVWSSEHKPISVSISSNILGFVKPNCIVNSNLDILLEKMMLYLNQITEKLKQLTTSKWGWVIDRLEDMMADWKPEKPRKRKISEQENEEEASESTMYEPPSKKFLSHMKKSNVAHAFFEKLQQDQWGIEYNDWEEEDTEEEENIEEEVSTTESNNVKQIMYNQLKGLYGKFQNYCHQLPVLGFNSANYDLNLIKEKLAKHLNMHDTTHGFTVKRNNAYTCISNDNLKFLDITQFLAPGTSYAKFLTAFGVEESKGYFPYEWFDDVTKLECTSLPPYDAFYSSLKENNVLEAEYIQWEKLGKKGSPPKSGTENFKDLQHVWKEKHMKSFKDFLVWYNNLDVGPFVEAVQKLQEFYRDRRIDIFKVSISVPGVARRMLFDIAKKAGATFAICDAKNADLYKTIKNNIVGGPSIIFTRHHKAFETYIRQELGKVCQRLVGFDANALYLWAIGQLMPTGPFIRRKVENEFRPERRDKYMSMYYWMDWLNHSENKHILHKLNYGKEKRIGPYPVDGYDPQTNTVYQHQGCYYHAHRNCPITKYIKSEKWHKEQPKKLERTKVCSQYIRDKGFNLVEMWECDFQKMCKENPDLQKFIDNKQPAFYQKHKGKVSEQQILNGVSTERLFGMVEVDIEVPETWNSEFEREMSPQEYFSEMSPLFCTTDVPFECIGDHMQKHAKTFDLGDKPRRLLIGGMKGRKMLIATPLLKWYLDHGMVVTNIYQVIEYTPQKCFEEFVTQVSDSRREGDKDKSKAVIADISKLIGNSAYGSMIMDKQKHSSIKYRQGERNACLLVNDPRFRTLTELDPVEEFYEIEMAKKRITLNLPIQLGYFILQYAKLRMLAFYYDFMDVYVDRRDFEYCEMDTDSAYMAISGMNLEDIIKPDMKDKYVHGLKGFCTNTDIKADSVYHWFPRTCCQEHIKYDKRTPGLFKLEYEGEEMIGLCSKTYIVRNKEDCKFSSKGISKNRVTDPMSTFRKVLQTQQPGYGINKGFRARNNCIFSYEQQRNGFSYFYCKRKVLDDGIHTVPLNLVLTPIKPIKED